jgi:biopolymer transport protein ExbB
VLSSIGGTLVDYYVKGGVTMHPMLICSIIGLIIIIERSIVLHRVKVNTAQVFGAIRSALMKRDLKGAIEVCDVSPSPISDTLRAGLLRFGKPAADIEKAMESVALHEISKLERGLWMLATIANVAPLFGFLGTVTGMIKSFAVLAEVGLGNPKAVAAGISEALITTAYGLSIALPVQAAFNYFTSRVSNFALDMETSSAMLMETFSELDDSSAPRDSVTVSSALPTAVQPQPAS